MLTERGIPVAQSEKAVDTRTATDTAELSEVEKGFAVEWAGDLVYQLGAERARVVAAEMVAVLASDAFADRAVVARRASVAGRVPESGTGE